MPGLSKAGCLVWILFICAMPLALSAEPKQSTVPPETPTPTPSYIASQTPTLTPTPWVIYATATPGIAEGTASIPGNIFRPLQGQPLTLNYSVPLAGKLEIRIFNRQGILVKTIEKQVGAGSGTSHWDGRTEEGTWAASGVYGAHFRGLGLNKIVKLVLVK